MPRGCRDDWTLTASAGDGFAGPQLHERACLYLQILSPGEQLRTGKWANMAAHDLIERSRNRLSSGALQMRKFILITSIALMSTSSCYANLSLASNEAPQRLVQISVRSGEA